MKTQIYPCVFYHQALSTGLGTYRRQDHRMAPGVLSPWGYTRRASRSTEERELGEELPPFVRRIDNHYVPVGSQFAVKNPKIFL